MSIATDTARGLAYLHTADKNRPLVHRDVKRYVQLLNHLSVVELSNKGHFRQRMYRKFSSRASKL